MGIFDNLFTPIIPPPSYRRRGLSISIGDNNFDDKVKINEATRAAAFELAKDAMELNKKIRVRNPNFNPEKMLAYAKKSFELLIYSRYSQNFDSIEHFLHNDLYQNICSEYKQLKEQNLLNFIKNINVIQKRIKSYEIVEDAEIMTINIKARFFNYYITADTKKYVKGNRYDAQPYLAELKFIKNKDYDKEADKFITNCPNCGAPLDEVHINVCTYCNTVTPLPKKEWLLISYDLKETVIDDMFKRY